MAQSTQNSQKQKAIKQARQANANVVEAFKDIGSSTMAQGADLLKGTSNEFMRQLFGMREARKVSGELKPGESLSVEEATNPVLRAQKDKERKLQAQITFERRLRDEEKSLLEKNSNDLKLKLNAIMQEVKAVAAATPNLAKEVEIATIQAPANPGIYHLFFFEKLLEFVRSFRERIENASMWLSSSNKRAEKKNYWSMYKKHGAKLLLSGESYSQRSVG